MLNSEIVIKQSLERLTKYGGFEFLETVINDLQNLNPDRKIRKKIFVSDAAKKNERKILQKRLKIWIDFFTDYGSLDSNELIKKCDDSRNVLENNLKRNLKIVLEVIRPLEIVYNSVSLFFKNTELSKLKNVFFLNAAVDQLNDLDNTRFIDFIGSEIRQSYDRLDIRLSYSLLVIPGYLGSSKAVDKFSKIAYQSKVIFVTDFYDLDHPDDVLELFEDSNNTGADMFKSNTVMTCNYLLARRKFDLIEEEDLYIPGSAALAGLMYKNSISQVNAGDKYGIIKAANAVRIDFKKREIITLENVGLVPMVSEYGRVMAFSSRTLYIGDTTVLQFYPIVRVFDCISKVVTDILNRRAFELWNTMTEREIRRNIVKFLDSVQGFGNLIERFSILRFERDETQKDKIYMDIQISPFYYEKPCLIKITGYRSDDGEEWETQYITKN